MTKKEYVKPTMVKVKLQSRAILLAGSVEEVRGTKVYSTDAEDGWEAY